MARTGYYLSDGYINLAILQPNPDSIGNSPRDAAGYADIDHLGFEVENLEEICKNLEDVGSQTTYRSIDMVQPSGSDAAPYYEPKYRGPDEQVVDVTESGWIGT